MNEMHERLNEELRLLRKIEKLLIENGKLQKELECLKRKITVV